MRATSFQIFCFNRDADDECLTPLFTTVGFTSQRVMFSYINSVGLVAFLASSDQKCLIQVLAKVLFKKVVYLQCG